MQTNLNYWIAQTLVLIFYVMTLIVYNRARNEYVGGKIGAALSLILVFMIILFFSDFVDYFFIMFVPLAEDSILIIKILLRLTAICVLFFGGLRFFVNREPSAGTLSAVEGPARSTASAAPVAAALPEAPERTVVLEEKRSRRPTLGRYEIIEQIGRGAMGIVYKGRDPKLNRLTAIKTIRFMDEFDDERVESAKAHFAREAEVVARLSHPNIVTVYDVGEDMDLSYLAMEYLEGESLVKHVQPGALLPVPRCIDIVVQVCDALAYAHRHEVIHRDIKPENIMLLKNGAVKVADFGIARLAGSTRTRSGVIKGTPFYLSPEQAKGQPLTGAADIFSLGVVFYQLLTGQLPFTGDSLAAIMYQTTMVDPEPPTTYNPAIDPALVAILMRALAKELDTRYATADAMAADLRRHQQAKATALPDGAVE